MTLGLTGQRGIHDPSCQPYDKIKESQNPAGGPGDGSSTNVASRNISPLQRRETRAFPALMSIGTQRSKELYSMNYVLDIDKPEYSTRQTAYHVNMFYKRLIDNRILPAKATPLLVAETSLLNKTMQRQANFSVRNANLSRTIQDDVGGRMVHQQSTFESASKAQLKQTLLPSINQLQSDDSLFGDDKTYRAVSKNEKYQPGGHSTITDNMMMNTTELTIPQTSKFTANMFMQMTAAESILFKQSLNIDRLAGNSVTSQLNTSFHQNAIDTIKKNIQTGHRKRSQQRRRRELGGEQQLLGKPGNFLQKSTLEEVVSDRSTFKTETESIANSSIYKEIIQDMDGFAQYYERERRKAEEPININPNDLQQKEIDIFNPRQDRQRQAEEDENRLMLEDPEAHFKKLKAKIKLKVVKLYQEDKEKKAQELTKAKEPVVIIMDQYGRAMPEIAHKLSSTELNSKPLSKTRRPVKKAPPERKMSFTEQQLKYYGAKDIFKPTSMADKPSLTNSLILQFMKEADRFPVPEALIGRQTKCPFTLEIDSLIKSAFSMQAVEEWAEYMADTKVPYNSLEDEEDFFLYESQESDDPNSVPYITQKKIKEDPTLKEKQFDIRILETSPYRLESMKFFPYRYREGEIPLKLLEIPKVSSIIEAAPRILAQQKEERWSPKLLQNIFEHYCVEMKAAPITLAKFYNYDDPNNTKLSFKNYQLDDMTVKAIALVLPFILDITEIEMANTQITDLVSSCLVFSVFMNPSLKRITFAYNYGRQTFAKVLARLIAAQPGKLADLNLMGSIIFNDHIDPLIRELPKMSYLTNLNIAGCALTGASCRSLSLFMIKCFTLRTLDVSHCRISYQGSRYLIDALNRNTCIRNFNFSNNDLNSQSYEFSIKVASIITRHPCLMHLDITNTQLRKEEIMFIGLAVPVSRTLLSIHLTSSKLPYYERIFLRAMVAARVAFSLKNVGTKKDVRGNREKNQILQMASGEVQDDAMRKISASLKDLDIKRNGLDFEIQDLLAELDTEATFQNLDPESGTIGDLPETSNIGILVKKLIERQKEIEAQQIVLERIYKNEQATVTAKVSALAGLLDIGKQNHEMFGRPEDQVEIRKPEEEQDIFQKLRELKVVRHQQRAEMEVIKENKDRSAGELALMFMGINQVAFDLLVENPMTGYMNEIIFSRVLGQEEIEEGSYWVDTTKCWVCHKWNKVTLAYHLKNDEEIFTQKVSQIDNLQQTINKFVNEGFQKEQMNEMEKEIETVQEADKRIKKKRKASTIFEAPVELEQTVKKSSGVNQQLSQTAREGSSFRNEKGALMSTTAGLKQTIIRQPIPGMINDAANSYEAGDGAQSDNVIDGANFGIDHSQKSLSQASLVKNPHNELNDTTNPLAPIKTTTELVKKLVFPEKFESVKTINYPMPSTEKLFGDELRKLDTLATKLKEVSQRMYGMPLSSKNTVKVTPLVPQGEKTAIISANALKIQNQYIGSKGGSAFEDDNLRTQTSIVSHREVKRRVHGQPVIIQRQIFFQGVIYQIDEELYSDSDHSSVYTSEDDFEEDKQLQTRFKSLNPQISEINSLLNTAKSKDSRKQQNTTFSDPVTPIAVTDSEPRTPISSQSLVKSDQTKKKDDGKGKRDKKSKKDKKSDDLESVASTTTPARRQSIVNKKLEPIVVKKKTYSKDKQAFAKEFFSNTPGLTQDQKEYESKLLPKHYKPELAAKRIKNFEENFTGEFKMLTLSPRKESAMNRNEGRTSHLSKMNVNDKLQDKEIFVVASFNDWMPCRMKTLRTMHLEQFPMDTEENEIPKSVKTMDNTMALYAQMVPPGVHYFYFVRERGTIFLSPHYEVVRFKTTSIFLNRVLVGKRLEDVDTVHQAKDDDIEEPVFMKDRSVFRDYREDTQAFLKKCFDEDINFGKIIRTIKKGSDQQEEFDRIKNLLFEHYVRIINIFTYYAGASSYPTIGMNDFTSFSTACKILDQENIGLAQLDLLLVATCVSHHQFVNSANLDMQRYEFLEMIVRLANFRYKENGKVKTTCEAIERLLEELIYPHAKSMDGDHFRRFHCYSVKVNEILKKNEVQLKHVYESFTHAKKRYIQNDECAAFVRKLGLKISEMMVGAIYAESMMTIIDPIRDQTKPKQMKYVEWLVFLCRIAHEHYKGGPYEKELLYLKLDHLMPSILGYLNLLPLFLFGEQFAIEEQEEKLKHKRRRQKLKRAQLRYKETGQPIDPRLLAEVKKYEENLKKAGKGTYMASQMGSAIVDSDSDLGHSTDEEKKYKRSRMVVIEEGQEEGNQVIQKSEIDSEVDNDGSPKGVVISRLDELNDRADPSALELIEDINEKGKNDEE